METMETKKFVAYYRVSTRQQGSSGLGLAAQQKAVKDYVKQNTLLAEFTEIESGKNDNRIELNKAIEFAKKNDAVLIVAKLDRLSRNVAFLFTLRDNNVNFVCCDVPDLNTLTIGIFSTLAQYERELISLRTKAALQVKKAAGCVLGNPSNLTMAARQKGIVVRKNNAVNDVNNVRAGCVVVQMRKANMPYSAIAKELNEKGFRTRNNKMFSHTQVKRLEVLFGIQAA